MAAVWPPPLATDTSTPFPTPPSSPQALRSPRQPPRPAHTHRLQRSLQALLSSWSGGEPSMQSAATVTRLIITAVPDGRSLATTAGTGLGAAPGAFSIGGDWSTTPAFDSHCHVTPWCAHAPAHMRLSNVGSWGSQPFVLNGDASPNRGHQSPQCHWQGVNGRLAMPEEACFSERHRVHRVNLNGDHSRPALASALT